MSNIIDKIQLSGVTYTIGGGGGGTGGTAVEEMTQAEYDDAASAGTLDAETLYIITDAEEINANEYVTKAQNNFSGYTEIKSMEGSYYNLYTNRTDIRTFYLSGTSSNDGVVALCIPNLVCEVQIGGFDFSTTPTNEYVDITYDSTNKIYTISIKSTYVNSYIEYGYDYNVENSKIWFINKEISSGQSAEVLDEFVPDVYNEIDKKPNKSATVKTDSLSVSQSNSTQWYLYYIDNAENGHSTSFEVCDGEGIVMADNSTKLSLRKISTVNAYTKEWIINECRYNICGNDNTTYNDAVSSITATFNSSLSEYNQFYFVVYYNSQGSINSLEWYITKREGTIYMSGAYLSDETSDFSTLNSEISANTGLNIEFSQSGLTYTKGTSNDPFICELYCNNCLQTNDSYSLFSSVITTQNKIGMYDAVNILFGNYEDGKYVETSAITSAVTSGSTDVLTSGGAYEQLGGLKLVKLTESEYAALVTKDPNVLYVVIPDPSNP